jgi:hypothetical protein
MISEMKHAMIVYLEADDDDIGFLVVRNHWKLMNCELNWLCKKAL